MHRGACGYDWWTMNDPLPVLAAVLGVLGFILGVYNILRDQPHVHVTAGAHALGDNFVRGTLSVLNVGSVPVILKWIRCKDTGHAYPGAYDPRAATEGHAYAGVHDLPRALPAGAVQRFYAPKEWIVDNLSPDGWLRVEVTWYRRPWSVRSAGVREQTTVAEINLGGSHSELIRKAGED